MLDESFSTVQPRPKPGDKVSATVIMVGKEHLILDLGGGLDGLMAHAELAEDGKDLDPKEGDEVQGFLLRYQDGVAELGMRIGRLSEDQALVERALETGIPVKGKVTEVNSGGFVVDLSGKRAFCPMGAMDVRRIHDPAPYIGESFAFRVTELRGSRDVTVSRRVLLEEERDAQAVETRQALEVGARMRGTVSSIRDFGAFVDLGGIDGLVPLRELSHGRVQVGEVVKEGDVVDVVVLSIEEDDRGKERIALSMKALQDDPFETALAHLSPGCVVAGIVTRIQPFGAFVELCPGVEGLIHVSAFGRRIGLPSDVVSPAEAVAVRVDKVDAEGRRIGLHYLDEEGLVESAPETDAHGFRILRSAEREAAAVEAREGVPVELPKSATRPATPEAPKGKPPAVGDMCDVVVARPKRFGVFVRWDGHEGLIPARELGVPRDADLRRKFPEGTELRAVVLEIREDGKIALSLTGVELAEEKADMEDYKRSAPPPKSSGGLGTLGDLLKFKRGD